MKLNTSLCIAEDTERLSFRKLALDDAEAWKDFVLSDAAMFFFTFPRIESESVAWIDRQLERYKNEQGGLMAVIEKDSGKLIGQCGLLIQELEGKQVLEVGYSFLPKYWGKGYATEAAAAYYKLGKDLNISHNVLSVVHVDNIASQKVAEKNGLKVLRTTNWNDMPVKVYGI